MPNVHKSEFRQLLDQAMSQTPDIVAAAESKGSEAKTALESATCYATCTSNVEGLEILWNRL